MLVFERGTSNSWCFSLNCVQRHYDERPHETMEASIIDRTYVTGTGGVIYTTIFHNGKVIIFTLATCFYHDFKNPMSPYYCG